MAVNAMDILNPKEERTTITMSIIDEKIAALQARALDYQRRISTGDSNEAGQLQAEFAAQIASEMGDLIANGAVAKDIEKVQELLRAVFDPMPNSYAPDASEEDEADEEEIGEIESFTLFAAVDRVFINSYETGQTDDTFLTQIPESNRLTLNGTLEIIDLIVNNYDTDASISGGEALANADGEAFVASPLYFKGADGASQVMCDPAVYQFEAEVADIYRTLSLISDEEFQNRFDLDRLIEMGAFFGCDEENVQTHEETIFEILLENFKSLCGIYKMAVENKQCILLIPMALTTP